MEGLFPSFCYELGQLFVCSFILFYLFILFFFVLIDHLAYIDCFFVLFFFFLGGGGGGLFG